MTGRQHEQTPTAADPADSTEVSLGEGGTPVVSLDRLAGELGLAGLSAKLELLNPTGSYKDRVAARSMSLAREQGCRGWIATSSGNAGAAMAAYGARVGLPGFLAVVSTAPPEKLAALMPYPVGLVAVDGVGDGGAGTAALMRHVREAAHQHQLFVAITAHEFNPEGMRGVDGIGHELADQVGDATCVYVPTGGGGLLVAVARGLSDRNMATRIIACQPAGCAPVARFLDGDLDVPVVPRCHSRISALQLPDPPDGRAAADAVIRSGGWGRSVSDDAILAAQRRLATAEGIFVEPAAATTLAALMADIHQGRVGPNDHPALILTGHGKNDLARFATDRPRTPIVAVDDITERINAWARDL